jgi:hypothetical protein
MTVIKGSPKGMALDLLVAACTTPLICSDNFLIVFHSIPIVKLHPCDTGSQNCQL